MDRAARRPAARLGAAGLIAAVWTAAPPTAPCAADGRPPGGDEAADERASAPLPRRGFADAAATFRDDGVYLLTFPKRTTAKGAWTTAAVVAGTALLIGRDDEIRREVVEHDSRSLDRAADRIEPLGKHVVEGAALGAAWLAGRAARNERLASASATAFEAFLWTAILASAAKGAFGRERPADGVDSRRFWKGDTIFPSGHTARSFAIAAVFADRYGRPAAWIGYPLAALVGLATVRQDTHWASDILAGAGLGLAIGKGIAIRHPGPGGRPPGAGGASPPPAAAWRLTPAPGGLFLEASF
jgi:hypothetical protein